MSSLRRVWLLLALLGAAVLTVVLLTPALVSPVTGDDRYYYLTAAGEQDWTPWGEIARAPEIVEHRAESGRVNALTAIERRLVARGAIDTAVEVGKPLTWVLALVKLALAALSLLCVLALVRALRWRTRAGTLVSAGGATLGLVAVAGSLAFAAGTQPQITGLSGLNAWISYPVSTWSAPISIFGVVALVLWLARLSAERGPGTKALSAIVLVLLGAVTNFRYELVFPAVPLALIALLVVPVTDRARAREGRRAKWLVGGAYALGFFPLFGVNRLYLRSVCARTDCYDGVQVGLDGMLRTLGINLVSPVPGTGRDEVRDLLDQQGMSTADTWTPTTWSILLALGVAVVLALAWWGARGGVPDPQPEEAAGADAADPDDVRSARARLHLVGAGLLLVGALGTAGLMSMSSGGQDGVSEVGILYRHAVLSWMAYAVAAVLLAVAATLVWRRAGVVVWAALAVALAALVAVQVPANQAALEANRSAMEVSERVNRLVVEGDLTPQGDRARCQARRDVGRQLVGPPGNHLRASADRAFRRYWGRPFCAGS